MTRYLRDHKPTSVSDSPHIEGESELPEVAFWPVYDEYGYRMVPDMRLLVPIAPVFIITKDPYVIPISSVEFEVTQ